MTPEQFLQMLVPARQKVTDFLTKAGPDGLQPNRGWFYDAELGWVHADSKHVDPRYGANDAITFCSYESFGARKVLNCAGQPARVHTYGDSFTHCDQVNDGETWQEYLAAHLHEPVLNFGVSGYSVYQAYRRMVKIHRNTEQRATHVILNIYEDDHYRNLDPWRSIRCIGRTNCGYTLPHIQVDLDAGTCKEHDNLCDTAEKVYRLCDERFVIDRFKDSFLTTVQLQTLEEAKAQYGDSRELTSSSDISRPEYRYTAEARHMARKMITSQALLATQYVVEKFERFTAERNMKLLIVLSFAPPRVESALRGEPRFDQTLLDWLASRDVPVIDLRDRFVAAFKQHGGEDMGTFLEPYWIGHQSPAGNFFTAWTVMDDVVAWLEPKSPAYQ